MAAWYRNILRSVERCSSRFFWYSGQRRPFPRRKDVRTSRISFGHTGSNPRSSLDLIGHIFSIGLQPNKEFGSALMESPAVQYLRPRVGLDVFGNFSDVSSRELKYVRLAEKVKE
jgi:hypothetical protein